MATERNGLRAWVRYDANNKAVAGSLIYQKNAPTSGVWKEYKEGGGAISYGSWKLVTGGAAGDGTVLVDNLQDDDFTFIGPNDSENQGWVYLTRYFANGATLSIDYQYATFDEGVEHDRPVYWVSNTQPTAKPAITTARVDSSPTSGGWITFASPGQWFSIGIYSDDSCCGRGFFSTQTSITELQPLEITSVTLSFPINYCSFQLRCNETTVGQYIFSDVTVNNAEEAASLFNSIPDSAQYGVFGTTDNPNVIKLTTSTLLKEELCPDGDFYFWVGAD